jgi:hypothetical protein
MEGILGSDPGKVRIRPNPDEQLSRLVKHKFSVKIGQNLQEDWKICRYVLKFKRLKSHSGLSYIEFLTNNMR